MKSPNSESARRFDFGTPTPSSGSSSHISDLESEDEGDDSIIGDSTTQSIQRLDDTPVESHSGKSRNIFSNLPRDLEIGDGNDDSTSETKKRAYSPDLGGGTGSEQETRIGRERDERRETLRKRLKASYEAGSTTYVIDEDELEILGDKNAHYGERKEPGAESHIAPDEEINYNPQQFPPGNRTFNPSKSKKMTNTDPPDWNNDPSLHHHAVGSSSKTVSLDNALQRWNGDRHEKPVPSGASTVSVPEWFTKPDSSSRHIQSLSHENQIPNLAKPLDNLALTSSIPSSQSASKTEIKCDCGFSPSGLLINKVHELQHHKAKCLIWLQKHAPENLIHVGRELVVNHGESKDDPLRSLNKFTYSDKQSDASGHDGPSNPPSERLPSWAKDEIEGMRRDNFQPGPPWPGRVYNDELYCLCKGNYRAICYTVRKVDNSNNGRQYWRCYNNGGEHCNLHIWDSDLPTAKAWLLEHGPRSPSEAKVSKGVKLKINVDFEILDATHESFMDQIKKLNPNMEPPHDWLITKIARQQKIRYNRLSDMKGQHWEDYELDDSFEDRTCGAEKCCLGADESVRYNFDPKKWIADIVERRRSLDLNDCDNDHAEGAYPFLMSVPPIKFPARFECQICFQVERFQAPSDWIQHVLADVEPFTCSYHECQNTKTTFHTEAEWARHENGVHRHFEWWSCKIDGHTTYHKESFLLHLVSKHAFPDPSPRPRKRSIKEAQSTKSVDSTLRMIEECHHMTTNRPQDEPCKFCGEVSTTWENLVSHLAEHMERIALPVILLLAGNQVNRSTGVHLTEQSSSHESYNTAPSINMPRAGSPPTNGISETEFQNAVELKGDSFDIQESSIFCAAPNCHADLISTRSIGPMCPQHEADANAKNNAPSALLPIVKQKAGSQNHIVKPESCPPKDIAKPINFFNHLEYKNPCQHIREWVLKRIPNLPADSTGTRFSASFEMYWDIQKFIQEQYRERPRSIGDVITLSGTASQAQASICSKYVQSHWPTYGRRIIDSIDALLEQLENGALLASISDSDDIVLSVTKNKNLFAACISGTEEALVEIIQILTWIGAAIRTSAKNCIEYSTIMPSTLSRTKFVVFFQTRPLSENEKSCWYPLFVNPVIALGFPIMPRNHDEVGLEIPIEMMAALGGVRYAVEFEGGLLLKGLESMFVPTKRHTNSIQWHLTHRGANTRITYSQVKTQYPDRVLLDGVGHESLKSSRTFLGWWRNSETSLGTDEYDYVATTYSSAMPSTSVLKTSASLGFSKISFGGQHMSIGIKDSKLFLSRPGPLQQILEWAEMMPILLYDVMDKRGWLVRASDVILHTIRTRHAKRPFRVDGKPVRLVGANHDADENAAGKAIMDMASVRLIQDDVNRANDYYVNDLVLDIWALLEGLSEVQNAAGDCIQDCGSLATNEKLQGWEFMALVNRKSPMQRKEVNLEHTTTGGWQNLVRDINAVVLLAHGFGDIIRPLSTSYGLCNRWSLLPKGRDFMAAGVPLLKQLCEEAGCTTPYAHLTSSKLQWHKHSMLFEKCTLKANLSRHCKCDRLQQVVSKGDTNILSVNPPGKLAQYGCVVFGQQDANDDFSLVDDPPLVIDSVDDQADAHLDDSHHNEAAFMEAHRDCETDSESLCRQDTQERARARSISVPANSRLPSIQWEGNGDYRDGGRYPSAADVESLGSPSQLSFEESSRESTATPVAEDVLEIERMLNIHKKRCFDDQDGNLREKKRVHLEPHLQPRCVLETERTRKTTVPVLSRQMHFQDSEHNVGATMLHTTDSHKDQHLIVTFETLNESEHEAHE